jgi:hypothetical protein
MGICLSWVAVRGKAADGVLAELGWRRTGRQEEWLESDTTCADLGPGWFGVMMRNREDAYDGTVDLGRLSKGGEVVACFVEEHVMFSGAVAWRDGAELWSIRHDAQEGTRHLITGGRLPPEAADIVDKARGAQDAEDAADTEVDFIFEVPVDVAQLVTGFRHDVDGVPLRFEVLEQVTPRRRAGWVRSIFGGRG